MIYNERNICRRFVSSVTSSRYTVLLSSYFSPNYNFRVSIEYIVPNFIIFLINKINLKIILQSPVSCYQKNKRNQPKKMNIYKQKFGYLKFLVNKQIFKVYSVILDCLMILKPFTNKKDG